MEEVLHYLELKNQYYEKFYSVTLRFLEQTNQNKWDDLELFVDNRERILNIIHSFDFKIAKHFQELSLSSPELEAYRKRVRDLLDTRATIAKKIVSLDLELIGKMDEMKSDVIRELKTGIETNQQLGAFTAGKPSPKPRKEV